MNTIDLSDYKQLPTVQAELSDLQLNTLGVAEFIVEHLREVYPDLEEGDSAVVAVLGRIEVNSRHDLYHPFVEGYFHGRIAEFLDTGAATVTLVRS